MDFSIIDLSPVSEGGAATDAYANTVETAKQTERLDYSRFWVVKHHGMANTLAGTTPEVLLGHLVAETDSIRLDSGAALLNHYSPFKVAEQFGALDGLTPGRINAGFGWANGSPAADQVLRTNRHVEDLDGDHVEKVEAVVNHLYNGYPDEHPYADFEIPRGGGNLSVPWVLGSSPSSATIAGEPGLPYCSAGFIRPQFAIHSFEEYRESFQSLSLGDGIDESHDMVAVNAVCAKTDEETVRLCAVAEASYKRMRRGEVGTRPTIEEAIDELGDAPEPTPVILGAKE